jgi:large subunit ribosomal protein L21
MYGGIAMYAVIRAGGKQYRVAPGDVVKIEKTSNSDQNIEFEVLAVSGEEGKIAKAEDAKVVGEIIGEGRADKILVFHFKRKKQYKKLNGHRQPFTEVRIAEISANGETFKAPEVAVKAPKTVNTVETVAVEADTTPVAKKAPAKKAATKKTAAKKPSK